MQEIINWLVYNWQFVSSVAISIVGFILLLLKKRYKLVDSAMEYLQGIVPTAVRYAEKFFPKGQKKDAAFNYLKEHFESLYPNLQWKAYIRACDFLIEDVLNTPEKKKVK